MERTYFYVVTKTDKGWKLANAIAFETLEQAKVAAAKFKRVQTRISNRVPGDVGFGWTSLNESALVNA